MNLDIEENVFEVRDIPEVRYLNLDNGNRVVFSRDSNAYGF